MQAPAKVRLWREDNGLTQEEAAKRVGCSQSVYSRIERGLVTPRASLQRRFYAVTGVSPNDWILQTDSELEPGSGLPPQGAAA